MNYDDLLWKCQGILSSQDYMRLAGLIVAERELRAQRTIIVNECIAVLNNRFMGDLNREDLEVRRCIADVKQHFGVEE